MGCSRRPGARPRRVDVLLCVHLQPRSTDITLHVHLRLLWVSLGACPTWQQ
jgi:hypothetical protein